MRSIDPSYHLPMPEKQDTKRERKCLQYVPHTQLTSSGLGYSRKVCRECDRCSISWSREDLCNLSESTKRHVVSLDMRCSHTHLHFWYKIRCSKHSSASVIILGPVCTFFINGVDCCFSCQKKERKRKKEKKKAKGCNTKLEELGFSSRKRIKTMKMAPDVFGSKIVVIIISSQTDMSSDKQGCDLCCSQLGPSSSFMQQNVTQFPLSLSL